MPVFYVTWEKAENLRKLLYSDPGTILSPEDLAFAAELLAQIDREWAKDKDDYARFVLRGKDYDEEVRRCSDEDRGNVNGATRGSGKGYSHKQVSSTTSKEGSDEEEEHF